MVVAVEGEKENENMIKEKGEEVGSGKETKIGKETKRK